jgi:hypothetical protein
MPDWVRTRRAVDTMNARLAAAQSEEDFQSVGHLAREVLISLAQAVYDPERHPTEDNVTPSNTDAKRMLSAYVGVEFSGGSNEEPRHWTKASISLAHALTHKRSATRRDANIVVAAVDAVVKIVEILAGETSTTSEPWEGVEVDGRYFAWSGPTLHSLPDRLQIPAFRGLEDALRESGIEPRFGREERLRDHLSSGRLQVFETDRRTWRRALLMAGSGEQVLLVVKPTAPKGKPRITSKGWAGTNAAGQTYQPYPSCRYHPRKDPVIVQNENESDALGDEWADTPFTNKD